MKKTTTDFKTHCRASYKKHSAVQEMEVFFQLNDLADTKERLNRIVSYAIKRNACNNEDSFVIFQFHQSMRTFIRAGYFIMHKERKWTVNMQLGNVSPWVLGLLSVEVSKSIVGFSKGI